VRAVGDENFGQAISRGGKNWATA